VKLATIKGLWMTKYCQSELTVTV